MRAKLLTGKALRDRGRELSIPGFSRMKAHDLRKAITEREEGAANAETALAAAMGFGAVMGLGLVAITFVAGGARAVQDLYAEPGKPEPVAGDWKL